MDEKLTLLGNAARLPVSLEDARVECFPNRSPDRDYWIQLDYPEFSSLCPVTGQPDTARLRIAYVPDALCIETKSLKYFLAAWRNTAAFNEDVVNRMLDILSAACRPRKIIIRGEFSPRGGIRLTAQASLPSGVTENPFGL